LSANAGSVIRFYIDINETSDETVVAYRNLYRRKDIKWDIRGTGRFVYDTLYLVGHATDVDKNDSHGMRMMALHRLGTTGKLCGIVLSTDRTFPIAARTLLLPIRDHATPELRDPKRSEKAVIGDMEDHTVNDVVDELYDHSLDDIKESPADDHILTFAMFIENITPTVLKAGGELSFNFRGLTAKMNQLRDAVRFPIGDGMAGRVSEGMDAALTGYLNARASFKAD
jgi:hypothetical protein